MSTNVTWPGGATDTAAATHAIPAAGELSWSALSDFLIALGRSAQSTTLQKFAVRKCTSSPVTVSAATDCVLISQLSVAGAVTVNLPAGANKQLFIIADGTGDAGTNNITVNRNGADTIAGGTSLVLSHNYEAVFLIYNSGDTDWKVIGRFAPPGTITNADVSASAAIAFSKLAALTSANILVGNGSNVATSVAMSGDVTISNAGVTAIGSSKVTSAMISGTIAPSKGGTGVSNNDSATLTRSGNHALTVTTSNTTSVTLPTSGTLCAQSSDYVLVTGNGATDYGSSDNKVRRLGSVAASSGSAVTYAVNSTNGSTFTVVTPGVYCITYTDNLSGISTMGLSLNSSSLSTTIYNLTAGSEQIAIGSIRAAGDPLTLSVTIRLAASDVIRPHTDGTSAGAGTAARYFRMVRVAD